MNITFFNQDGPIFACARVETVVPTALHSPHKLFFYQTAAPIAALSNYCSATRYRGQNIFQSQNDDILVARYRAMSGTTV